MKKDTWVLFVATIAGAFIGLAQSPSTIAPGPPGESPGNIIMGPGGYWQKGPAAVGRAGSSGGRGASSRGAGRGDAVPSVSVRPAGARTRTTLTALLGWSVGASASAFPKLTFS